MIDGVLKLMKNVKLWIILLSTLGIVLGINLIMKDNTFKFESETIMIDKENYNIRISYPKLNDREFRKKLEKIIVETKQEFLDEVKEIAKSQTGALHVEYELNINYSFMEKDDIMSIHFKIFKFVGGAHYEREDFIFYYDKANNKEVTLDDLIKDKEEFYNVIREKCRNYLLENKEKLMIYEENELLNEGLKNIDYIIFAENAVLVLFPPYQVGPWSSGEIDIEISYLDIGNYLNESYLKYDASINTNDIIQNNDNEDNEGVVIMRDIEELKDKMLVALTFDDGPSWDKTEKLLDGLKERNAKVSFFMLGSRIKGQEKLVRRIYEEGHTIGSHSYEHKNFHNIELVEAMNDINKTNEMLKEITGVTPSYLRPPYGNYSKEILEATDMTFILWNIDTLDWKKKDSNKIADAIIENVSDGDIILLHDLYDTSIEGAFLAIDELSKEGFAFVSLDELLAIKGIKAESHMVYRYFK